MPGRYFKINLQAYLRHGTIEFRQHSGSANATKVCNWVRFLQAFIDESCRRAHPEITAAPQPSFHGRGDGAACGTFRGTADSFA